MNLAKMELLRESIKNLLQRTRLYSHLLAWRNTRGQRARYRRWLADGRRGATPHLGKQAAIHELADRFGVQILVETGTYRGDMVHAMHRRFREIHSIELSPELYANACRRFAAFPSVHLHRGDSAEVLGAVVSGLDAPALFWLDGHYSGGITARGDSDCPIYAELRHVFASPVNGHVILVDDARYFTGECDYPSVEALSDFVHRHRPDASVEMRDDMIRILPAGGVPHAERAA